MKRLTQLLLKSDEGVLTNEELNELRKMVEVASIDKTHEARELNLQYYNLILKNGEEYELSVAIKK